MTEAELIRRADMVLSDLASGGELTVEQSNRFFRKAMDEAVILKDARQIAMRRPTMEINKIGFGSRVLRAGRNSKRGGHQISSPTEAGTRALTRAERAKPTTERVLLETEEVVAEIDLPYEVLEDSIENQGGIDNSQLQQTILDLLAQRVSLDLEEMVITGDTASGDDFLALQDGVLKLATSNIVNHGGDGMTPDLFANMMKALPTKYHKLFGRYRFYLSKAREIDYRMTIAQRQTQLGDAILDGRTNVAALGIPMSSAAYMPNSNVVMMIPANLIIGFQRNIRLEIDRDIRERAIVMVLTMRIAMNYEEEDMVVKAINVG